MKSDIFCPFCNSKETQVHSLLNKISICKTCDLAYNDIDESYDYVNETDFVIDNLKLLEWKGFAERDYHLISDRLSNKGKNLRILELGSGYGFLSDLIIKNHQVAHYFHFEKNAGLQLELKRRGNETIESLDEVVTVDFVIMSHVLEHIDKAPIILQDLMERFPSAEIILYQTNYQGFIPKYLPWLWYGWSFDQHYFHFTPKSLTSYFEKFGYAKSFCRYYKLDQKASLSLKGVVKAGLSLINRFIKSEQSDAFVIGFKRQ